MKFHVITAMILLMTMTGCSQNEAVYRNMTRKAEPEKKITTPSRITQDEIAKISELHNRLRSEIGAETSVRDAMRHPTTYRSSNIFAA